MVLTPTSLENYNIGVEIKQPALISAPIFFIEEGVPFHETGL